VRKIDLVASPCGASICVEGRRHTEFDSPMPIECKRLPTPQGNGRDEREYVISRYSSTEGIQRFKAGNHASPHTFGAMIGYVQEGNTAVWETRVAGWINDLTSTEPGWTAKDGCHSLNRAGGHSEEFHELKCIVFFWRGSGRLRWPSCFALRWRRD